MEIFLPLEAGQYESFSPQVKACSLMEVTDSSKLSLQRMCLLTFLELICMRYHLTSSTTVEHA